MATDGTKRLVDRSKLLPKPRRTRGQTPLYRSTLRTSLSTLLRVLPVRPVNPLNPARSTAGTLSRTSPLLLKRARRPAPPNLRPWPPHRQSTRLPTPHLLKPSRLPRPRPSRLKVRSLLARARHLFLSSHSSSNSNRVNSRTDDKSARRRTVSRKAKSRIVSNGSAVPSESVRTLGPRRTAGKLPNVRARSFAVPSP